MSDAKSQLRKAKDKEKAVQVGSIVGGLALGVVTFGLGGLVAGAAVGAGVGALINELEGKVDRAQWDTQRRREDIERAESEISSINQSLSSARSQISDYSRRISENERKMRVKGSIDFQKEAVQIWELCVKASEKANERTQRLKGIPYSALFSRH